MRLHCLAKPVLFVVLILLFSGGLSLRGMVFCSTADLGYNTSAPNVSGTPTDGGWQWVGYWGSFQGTPIDAHHFLAANHVGGTVGDLFIFQSVNYTTVQTYGDASSDLRIWEVREPFPTWAPLYRNSTESGSMMVFGRGVTRGAEVRTTVDVTGVPANSLAGWQWGGYDGKLRWGQNTVVALANGGGFGQQLVATFDKAGGVNECDLGSLDSSAPVFIKDGTAWKLAGVAGLVDGGFSTTSGGATFNAFIFDKRGLFIGGNSGPTTGSSPVPCAFYSTRVSARIAWIDSVLATPLTATLILGNLSQTYDGSPHPVTVTTNPAGLSVSVTYDGAAAAPINAGSYAVVATVTSSGYSGSASGTLTIAAEQTNSSSSDVPISSPQAIVIMALLLLVTGSSHLRKSTRRNT